VTRHPEGPGWVPPARPVIQRRGLGRLLSLRAAALALIGAGLLVCLVPLGLVGYGMWQEDQLTDSWSRGQAAAATPSTDEGMAGPATPVPETPTSTPRGQAVQAAFAIRVPKIGYYAAVREGVSLSVLATGPGHYPSTAMPGRPGLVGIAAHNTFWIPFGQLGPGDTVLLETRSGRFTYRITETRIVEPDDRTVLVQTSDPRLVLTTCWPLWAGNLAPQRLVISAQQV
jgi:sortase A